MTITVEYVINSATCYAAKLARPYSISNVSTRRWLTCLSRTGSVIYVAHIASVVWSIACWTWRNRDNCVGRSSSALTALEESITFYVDGYLCK